MLGSEPSEEINKSNVGKFMADRYEIWEEGGLEPLEMGDGQGPNPDPKRIGARVVLRDRTIRHLAKKSVSYSVASDLSNHIYEVRALANYNHFYIHDSIDPFFGKQLSSILHQRGLTSINHGDFDPNNIDFLRHMQPKMIVAMDNRRNRNLGKQTNSHLLLFEVLEQIGASGSYTDAFTEVPIPVVFDYRQSMLAFPSSRDTVVHGISDFIEMKLNPFSRSSTLVLPLDSIIVDTAKHFDELFRMISLDIGELERIEARKLEQLVAELFSREGWDVHPSVRKTRDGGFDGVITKQHTFGLLTFIYECKSKPSGKSIGAEIVRGFNTVIGNQNANGGILCAASKISRDAKLEAEQYYKLMYLQDIHALHARIRAIRGI